MSQIDHPTFLAAARNDAALFAGSIGQSQIDGLDGLVSAWERDHAGGDPRWLAYALATVFHETARTFRPIEEYGRGKGRDYGTPVPPANHVYYGRGFVQLTWECNYRKVGARIGIDLVSRPELALDVAVATKILFVGMIEGLFSGRKLADYIGAKTDWVGARRIINGQDKAQTIAGYAQAFLACITTTS